MAKRKYHKSKKINRKRNNRIVKKQAIKYFVWFLVFVIGASTYRALWSLSDTAFYWTLGISIATLLGMAIFDLAKWKDVISIFKN